MSTTTKIFDNKGKDITDKITKVKDIELYRQEGINLKIVEIIRDSNGVVDLKNTKASLYINPKRKEDIAFNSFGFDLYLDDLGALVSWEKTGVFPFSGKAIETSLYDWLDRIYFFDPILHSAFSNDRHNLFCTYPYQEIQSLDRFALKRLLPRLHWYEPSIPVRSEFTKSPKKLNEFVYLIGCEETKTLKIGYTTNLKVRLESLQSSNPFELKVINFKRGTIDTEKELLERFKELRLKGEWFKWDESIINFFDTK